MSFRQLMGWPLRQEAAAEGEGAGGGEAAGGEGTGTEGTGESGGMMRAHSQAGQAGGEGEGDGGDDPFKASASDDGRPTIKDDEGNEIPLPDQFWDAENQQVRHDSMFKAFRDTKSSHDRLQQERDQLKQQMQEGKPPEGTVPDKPDGYEFTPPEGLQREIPSDDPMLQSFREIAHANNIPQEQFNAVAGQFMAKMEEQLGPPLDPDQERKQLGPNADTILEANARWVDGLKQDGMLSQEEHDELLSLGETATGVRALNKLREKVGEQPIPMEGAKMSELPSKQEWYQQFNAAMDKGDQAEIKRLEKVAEQVFGTGPAGSSEAGLGVPG